MVTKVEHIGICVRDLKASMEKYTDLLGLELREIEEVQVEGALNRIAFLPLGGLDVELLHTEAETGLIADFLKERGEGIHHIAFEVEDLEGTFEKLRSRGVSFLWDAIVPGSRGTRIAFFRPEEFNGVYIELVQKK
jgi:methylmalonyl-CoA epimerase